MSELSDLRAEVLRQHRLVTRKIQRNAREKGINLAGSEFDPRRQVELLNKYNRRQLEAYSRNLGEFRSRKTQFEQGHRGSPLPRNRVAVLRAAMDAHNEVLNNRLKVLSNIKLPVGNETVAGRAERMNPTGKYSRGRYANRPDVMPTNINTTEITSAKNLEKMIKTFGNKNSPAGRSKDIRSIKKQINQMLKPMDKETAKKIRKAVRALNDDQLDVLFNYTSFANSLSLKYAIDSRTGNDDDEVKISAVDNQISGIEIDSAIKHAKWAKTLSLGSRF